MVPESVLALNEQSLLDQWHWILECLRDVLNESGEQELARSLPTSDSIPEVASGLGDSVHLTQAYSIAFQLLGMAEQNAADQFRKTVEHKSGMAALPALWGDCLKQLKEQGLSAAEIASRLPQMQVELVLTRIRRKPNAPPFWRITADCTNVFKCIDNCWPTAKR